LIFKLNTDFGKLCNEWSELRLKVNLKNGHISFFTPDSVLNADCIKFGDKAKIKILFGASSFGHFKTTDVPAMNIRDIKLLGNKKIVHYFPLDEQEGNFANDKLGKQAGKISQPIWIRPEHYYWKNIYQTELEGNSQVAFDSENEEIILIGTSQIIKYSIKGKEAVVFVPQNVNPNLLPGCQAFYCSPSRLLYSFNIDQPSISTFNFEKLSWTQKTAPGNIETVFWHFNKFYLPSDSSLYVFGGYGQYKYKNLVQQYKLRTEKLKMLETSGDNFNPRYLSALGEMNDTIYIIGGFGSISGEQIYNPHNYYDLMAFSLKDHKFIKKFDYDSPLEDMAFANSMIIDPIDRSYYILAFPIFKYEGYLQLIKGSISNPEYSFMGGQIPYFFSDIKSFADLYYCRQSKNLVAVTILSDLGKSKINIYSLAFPPNKQVVNSATRKFQGSFIFLIIILLFTIGGIVAFFFYRAKIRMKMNISADKKIEDNLAATITSTVYRSLKPCSIQFFGEFQVSNESGKDITRKFTPLLKELFLLIWLNSVKNDIGISNEKLIEILWFDFSESSAHNNKAVNIAKLRAILTEIGNCELSQKTGYWKIDYTNKLLCNDYLEFLKIIKSQKVLSEQQIFNLLEITQKGAFLSDLNYDWLDEFKSAVSNDIIDHLINYASKLNIGQHPDLIIQLTDSIFNFDCTNEEAMVMKCKALISMGRHSFASDTYNKFAREYKTLYGSDFEKSFTDIFG
jgi:DNA-binding SARP family transcriptional activator